MLILRQRCMKHSIRISEEGKYHPDFYEARKNEDQQV